MTNFWENHTWVFILAMFFFPRLTMLFATSVGGGCLYWIGFVFAPRLTVAIIGTYLFYHTNGLLLIFTWIWALVGEGVEKIILGGNGK